MATSHFRERLVERFPALDPQSPVYRWLVLGTVMIATFMAVLDATIVNVALAKLMATFGVSVDRVEWILTAYLLIFGVMLASSGWMADRWGYKRMFILGLFLFTVGSFLCSLAWTIEVLIAFRVIQGAGAGFLMPVGMAIITREFPPEKRGIALGFWSVAASASVSLGPTLGGYLIDRFRWNTIFDVNVPVGIMGIAVAAIVLRENRPSPKGAFDIVGIPLPGHGTHGPPAGSVQRKLCLEHRRLDLGLHPRLFRSLRRGLPRLPGHGVHHLQSADPDLPLPKLQLHREQPGAVHLRRRDVRGQLPGAHLPPERTGLHSLSGRSGLPPSGDPGGGHRPLRGHVRRPLRRPDPGVRGARSAGPDLLPVQLSLRSSPRSPRSWFPSTSVVWPWAC